MKEFIRKNVEKLVLSLIPKCQRIEITDHVNKDDLYLVRYILFKSKLFSIYIHRFMQSDSSIPHDHPWNFFTYIVTEGYTEESFAPAGDKGALSPSYTYRSPGSLAYRKAECIHRVELEDERIYIRCEEEDAPLTVCILLKRKRIWGFIEPITKDGETVGYSWLNWLDFLGITKDDPRYEGSE